MRRRLPAAPACENEGWCERLATPDLSACGAAVFVLRRAAHCRKPAQLPGERAGDWPALLRRPEVIRAERSECAGLACRYPAWGVCALFASVASSSLSQRRI